MCGRPWVAYQWAVRSCQFPAGSLSEVSQCHPRGTGHVRELVAGAGPHSHPLGAVGLLGARARRCPAARWQ